jgi:hypothetical protein
MSEFQVIKCNPRGEEKLRYPGRVVERKENELLVEAQFSLEQGKIFDVLLHKGDPFLETYYSDRWFNIFEVHAREDGALKGWYCNVTYPAEISEGSVTYRDLALDLWVYPDGRQVVMDEDEFAELDISEADKQGALDGLAELQRIFQERFAGK